jgi:hypothetical protein
MEGIGVGSKKDTVNGVEEGEVHGAPPLQSSREM